jgi:hypothetical protein
MPNPTFRRWTADEIVKLKNLAQKHPAAQIAAQLGGSRSATSVKAHDLKLSFAKRPKRQAVQARTPDRPVLIGTSNCIIARLCAERMQTGFYGPDP